MNEDPGHYVGESSSFGSKKEKIVKGASHKFAVFFKRNAFQIGFTPLRTPFIRTAYRTFPGNETECSHHSAVMHVHIAWPFVQY